jgi:hypothetical protein
MSNYPVTFKLIYHDGYVIDIVHKETVNEIKVIDNWPS